MENFQMQQRMIASVRTAVEINEWKKKIHGEIGQAARKLGDDLKEIQTDIKDLSQIIVNKMHSKEKSKHDSAHVNLEKIKVRLELYYNTVHSTLRHLV